MRVNVLTNRVGLWTAGALLALTFSAGASAQDVGTMTSMCTASAANKFGIPENQILLNAPKKVRKGVYTIRGSAAMMNKERIFECTLDRNGDHFKSLRVIK